MLRFTNKVKFFFEHFITRLAGSVFFIRFIGRVFVLVGLLFAVLGAGLWLTGADMTAPAGQL